MVSDRACGRAKGGGCKVPMPPGVWGDNVDGPAGEMPGIGAGTGARVSRVEPARLGVFPLITVSPDDKRGVAGTE